MALVFALAVGVLMVAAGMVPARRLWPGASRGEAAALAGALSMAAVSYLVAFAGWIGQLRGGLILACALLLVVAVAGARRAWADLSGGWAWPHLGWTVAFAAVGAVAVIAAMSPPLTIEWDSLAYHLALPKIWLHLNATPAMPYDHHSYFPQLMEMLYTGGLAAAGYGGAKLMHTFATVLTVLAAVGFTSRHAGRAAGRWAALALAGCPLALWEAGTAYVDIGTALYTVLAVLMLHDARMWPLTLTLPPRGEGIGRSSLGRQSVWA